MATLEDVVDVFIQLGLGALGAFLIYLILKFVLATPTPIVAVVSNSMKHEVPEITHYKWLRERFGYNDSFVDSWPLANGFSRGDMIIVKGEKKYKVGDVIVFQNLCGGPPIIHRVVHINPDGTYQTKGDNNPGQLKVFKGGKLCYDETRIQPKQIYGKGVVVIPMLGWFKIKVVEGLDWLRTSLLKALGW